MSDPRDDLAALINGGPLPTAQTVGAIYARHTAYERAAALLAAGWRVPLLNPANCDTNPGHDFTPTCTHCGITQDDWLQILDDTESWQH